MIRMDFVGLVEYFAQPANQLFPRYLTYSRPHFPSSHHFVPRQPYRARLAKTPQNNFLAIQLLSISPHLHGQLNPQYVPVT